MNNKYPHILQTPEWGIAKSSADPSWKYFFSTNDNNRSGSSNDKNFKYNLMVLEKSFPLGFRMHYVPRGPFVDWSNLEAVRNVLNRVKEFAKKREVIFTRIEPNESTEDFPYGLVEKYGLIKKDTYVQVRDTVKIDLRSRDLEQILLSFHKKHRYNMRLSERSGLKFYISKEVADIDKFYKLLLITDKRQRYALHPHSLQYYKTIFSMLSEKNMSKIVIVEKNGVPCSASILFTYGNEYIYMYGASDYQYRKDMPNYLRELISIKEAIKNKIDYFDLWGLTMRNDPGEGIKRYKLGYSQKFINLCGSFDYINNPALYKLYLILENIRGR